MLAVIVCHIRGYRDRLRVVFRCQPEVFPIVSQPAVLQVEYDRQYQTERRRFNAPIWRLAKQLGLEAVCRRVRQDPAATPGQELKLAS